MLFMARGDHHQFLPSVPGSANSWTAPHFEGASRNPGNQTWLQFE